MGHHFKAVWFWDIRNLKYSDIFFITGQKVEIDEYILSSVYGYIISNKCKRIV